MMIISFAYTTSAFLAGRKTRTRRHWADDHVKKFHIGDIIQAYDKSPRSNGKRVGYARIIGLKKENIKLMSDDDFEKEGFGYLEEQGQKMWGKDARTAFNDWRQTNQEYWVVNFEKVERP